MRANKRGFIYFVLFLVVFLIVMKVIHALMSNS